MEKLNMMKIDMFLLNKSVESFNYEYSRGAIESKQSTNRPSKARRKLLGLRHISPSLRYGETSFMAEPLVEINLKQRLIREQELTIFH